MADPEQTVAETTTTPAPVAPAPSTEAAPAASAPAASEGEPKTVLDAAMAALDRTRAAGSGQAEDTTDKTAATVADDGTPKPPPQPPQQQQQQQQRQPDGGRLTDEEVKALPPRAQSRLRFLAGQAQSYKTNFENCQPAVKGYNDLQKWTLEQGVSQEEFTWGLQLIAAVRNDPAAAYAMVQQVLPSLQKHVGDVLPQDLQDEVTAGALSPERAKQLQAARMELARRNQQATQRDAVDREAQVVRQHVALTQANTNALASYEKSWKGSDPDFAQKHPATRDRFFFLMQTEGAPRNPQEAVTLLDRARKDVEKYLSGILPAPKPKDGLPPGGSSARTKVEPSSALEAAQLALKNMPQRKAA